MHKEQQDASQSVEDIAKPTAVTDKVGGNNDYAGETTTSHRWYSALDGWRGIAVLAVVAFHADVIPGGWLGVDLFFVLSGFLITRVLLRGRENAGKVDLVEFWKRRFRRLLPALLVVLVAVAALAALWPHPAQLPTDLRDEAVATLTYTANWQMLFSSSGYWDQFSVESPLRHMWSLAIEEQFYIVFPLVAAAVLAWRKRALGWVLALATLVSWGTALILLHSGASFERVYLGTDTRLGAITLGAFIGYLTTTKTRQVLEKLAKVLAPFAAVFVAVLMVVLSGKDVWTAQRWMLVLAFEMAAVVVLVHAMADKGVLNRIASWKVLVFFGAISYGLYLWHIPLQFIIEWMLPDIPPLALLGVVLCASTAVAWISLKIVEAPLRRDGVAAFRKLHLPPRTAGVVVTVAALCGTLLLFQSAGQPLRQEAREYVSSSIAAPEQTSTTQALLEETPPVGDTFGTPTEVLSLPLAPPQGRAPRVLMIGDSMAADLGEWFIPNQEALGVVASSTSHVGCGVGGISPQTQMFDDQFKASCERWRENLATQAASAAPDVTFIVRFASREPDTGDRCSTQYLSWFQDGFSEEIQQLQTATNAPVVVLTIPYNRAYGVGDLFDAEVDCLNDVINTIGKRNNVPIVDLASWICPEANCREYDNGTLLRPDGLHFTGEGAGTALKWILSNIYGEK